MRSRAAAILGAALALVAAPAASTAGGATTGGVRQTVTATATTTRTGAPMGVTVTARYTDGATPPGRPHSLTHASDGLPVGTTVDTSGVPQCHAADATLILMGAAACPAASIVGSGHVTLDDGLPAPLGALPIDVTLINAGSQIWFLGREPRTGIGLAYHGILHGATIEIDIPSLPGLGPEGTVVTQEDFTITRASHLLRAPRTCPRTGHWVFRRGHTYADGVIQTARVALPCRRPHRRHAS